MEKYPLLHEKGYNYCMLRVLPYRKESSPEYLVEGDLTTVLLCNIGINNNSNRIFQN